MSCQGLFWYLPCFAGEGLKVLACIQNNSTRNIKPKYCVYRKHSFFAQGKRKCSTKDLLKEVGEPIVPSATEKFTKVIPIPLDAEPSILNCSIIKAEYRLRVKPMSNYGHQLPPRNREAWSSVYLPTVSHCGLLRLIFIFSICIFYFILMLKGLEESHLYRSVT